MTIADVRLRMNEGRGGSGGHIDNGPRGGGGGGGGLGGHGAKSSGGGGGLGVGAMVAQATLFRRRAATASRPARLGAHTEKATAGAAPVWYFAEGSQGFFSTYFLLVNPSDTANVAHVTWLRQGEPALVRDYPLGPRARLTLDAGQDLTKS